MSVCQKVWKMSRRSASATRLRRANTSRRSFFTSPVSTNTRETRQTMNVLAPLLACSLMISSGLSPNSNFWNETTKLDSSLESLSNFENVQANDDDTTDVINWSGTHKVTINNSDYYEPESIEEVEKIVRQCHAKGQALRPIGSSLSPNGIALNSEGMISMANLDDVVEIDKENKTITVQAGITVHRVIEVLRPHGLTLPNLASIAEQQMGGLVQVGAHGTGRLIGPLDHYVKRLKLVTPGLGTITLSEEDNGALFHLAKVGLGCLGVVVEVTMDCIPAHHLLEHTFVLTRKQAREQKDSLLKNHKHMRFMWIPYADAVVVVTNDPIDKSAKVPKSPSKKKSKDTMDPLKELFVQLHRENDIPFSEEDIMGMGFEDVRDMVLAFDPLNIEHIKRCNRVEAEFWKFNEGYQIKPSDQLLQFACGGQQWVFEVCFPTGTAENNNNNDMKFLEHLLEGIETKNVAAHTPIEQRWCASSSSLMSPAYGPSGGLHSWVGIINYLPTDDPKQREAITNSFTSRYSDQSRAAGKHVNAVPHWAKLEFPRSVWHAVDLKMLYQDRYPVAEFNKARKLLDPKNIMSNPLLNLVLGDTKEQ